ncbi:hypothetical protein VCR6J2_90005 [Vibrio coralliirubri]|nr:hypothetical protein VCR6J2_90005 [Vibrio coralliirubri]
MRDSSKRDAKSSRAQGLKGSRADESSEIRVNEEPRAGQEQVKP